MATQTGDSSSHIFLHSSAQLIVFILIFFFAPSMRLQCMFSSRTSYYLTIWEPAFMSPDHYTKHWIVSHFSHPLLCSLRLMTLTCISAEKEGTTTWALSHSSSSQYPPHAFSSTRVKEMLSSIPSSPLSTALWHWWACHCTLSLSLLCSCPYASSQGQRCTSSSCIAPQELHIISRKQNWRGSQ